MTIIKTDANIISNSSQSISDSTIDFVKFKNSKIESLEKTIELNNNKIKSLERIIELQDCKIELQNSLINALVSVNKVFHL